MPIFFIFSIAIENSPYALEESMLIGILIISTFGGGISSVIDNNKTGILANEGDPYTLAGTIIEMLGNYKDVQKLG